MKQKPKDCAIGIFKSLQEVYVSSPLEEQSTAVSKGEFEPRDPSLDSAVDCICLVHNVRAPPSPALGAGRPLCLDRALSRPMPFPSRDHTGLT